jgi:hypothetical protein
MYITSTQIFLNFNYIATSVYEALFSHTSANQSHSFIWWKVEFYFYLLEFIKTNMFLVFVETLQIFFEYMFQKWSRLLIGPLPYEEVDITGKTVIVTGGNSGVGKATVQELVQRGAVVVVACRNMLEGKKAINEIKSKLPGSAQQMVIVIQLFTN